MERSLADILAEDDARWRQVLTALAEHMVARVDAEFADETELRDHWDCSTCSAGLCMSHGVSPRSLNHVLADGTVCGTYELKESGIKC
jgi:hypothetical protein